MVTKPVLFRRIVYVIVLCLLLFKCGMHPLPAAAEVYMSKNPFARLGIEPCMLQLSPGIYFDAKKLDIAIDGVMVYIIMPNKTTFEFKFVDEAAAQAFVYKLIKDPKCA